LWAWKEREENIQRGDAPITGIKITKTTPTVAGEEQGFVGEDMFFRPINFHPSEDSDLTVYLVPETYEKAGVYTERAHLKLGEMGEKLYFNEFTGEVMPSGSLTSERKQIYALNKSEILEVGINPPTYDIYPEEVGKERDLAPYPETFEDVGVYIETGNLISDISQFNVYLRTGDILGIEEGQWAGFFPAVTVYDILPTYMPRSEINLSEKEDLFPVVKITEYPDINPGINLNRLFSNVNIKESRARLLGGQNGPLDWVPVYASDPPGTSQTEAFTITYIFDRPIMLSKMLFEYEVYGGETQNPALDGSPAPVPASVDPSIRITISNISTGNSKVILDKPEFRTFPNFVPRGLSPFTRTYEFSKEEYFKGRVFYNKIEFSVGSRNPETGFRINLIDPFAKFIKETSEKINIREVRY
jgi:hypothetical protein